MSQSPSKYLTELARKGDINSLNTLLSYFMQKIGVTARSSFKGSIIELIIEGHISTPNQQCSEKYLRNFFDYLQIPTIREVKVFAKTHDTRRLAWYSILKISSPESKLSASTPSSSELSHQYNESCTQYQAIPSTNALVANQLQLPQPIPYEKLPSSLQERIRRAGTRKGDPIRSHHEAKQMYEMIPENVRRKGIAAIDDYKRGHHWSHKKAHSKGGSNRPSNGDWETPKTNVARGQKSMTKAEANNIVKAKAQINFQEGAKIVGCQAAKAGALAFGVEVAFSGLENFLAVQRGEKTVEQALGDTLLRSTGAAIVAVAVVGGVCALTLTFPPVGAALGAATPFLQIVGVAGSMSRLVAILSDSGKVEGIDQLEILMASCGLDSVELDFRDLEVEDDLLNLKLAAAQIE
ncbi:MAG: hypothetical protein ACFB8W_11320 [Elainellaceae cyanobacterium]